MKKLFVLSLLFATPVFAQSIDVNDVSADGEETTTVEITKGKTKKTSDAKVQIVEGSEDLESKPMAMEKEARADFDQACATWKKDLKENNPGNVLNANCGKITCGGSAGKKICSSTATYKIKTKLE